MNSFSLADNKGKPIDFKLNEIINKNNGFYIELGANDGLTQSNTAFFEKYRGWKGILIEPSINKYMECKNNRSNNNIVLNYACVSNDYKDEYIYGDFNGSLMSSIDGKRLNNNNLNKVNAITLEKILDNHLSNGQTIDLLSLDTEGYELNILKGLNLEKYRPKYMIIEIYNYDYNNIIDFLQQNNYKLLINISNYNKLDNPVWDGTHNDYLFIDTI